MSRLKLVAKHDVHYTALYKLGHAMEGFVMDTGTNSPFLQLRDQFITGDGVFGIVGFYQHHEEIPGVELLWAFQNRQDQSGDDCDRS